MQQLKDDLMTIFKYAIEKNQPASAVKSVLANYQKPAGKTIIIAIGKAGYAMAKAALEVLGKVDDGLVITKYGHALSALENIQIMEAGHPVSDENSFKATKKAIELVKNLTNDDVVIMLISGGGSALFEAPLISEEEIIDINKQLLNCGADITEINTIRKKLSAVKGGKFANYIHPAKIINIILSDVIGDDASMIASGPTVPLNQINSANEIIKKYHLNLSEEALSLINKEDTFINKHVETYISGSVKNLCLAAKEKCLELGYKPTLIKTDEQGIAKEVGTDFSKYIKDNIQNIPAKTALIFGGETRVIVKGTGKGGRNQELALSCAQNIADLNVIIGSIGSDGSDGPTDAAGGYVDGNSYDLAKTLNLDLTAIIENNDSYHGLKKIDGLIITGPTGTNVNDLVVALID